MFRPLRSLVAFGLLAAALWAAFTVDLGDRSFAQHMDTISETPEAQELIEGTRATINPALQEARDRVLGEYVEAPTWIADEPRPGELGPPPLLPSEAAEREARVPASTLDHDDGFEPSLPGRDRAPTFAMEPPLPGRR